MFNVIISTVEKKVLGEFLVDSYFFEPSKYNYAFYLFKDGKKIDTVGYSSNMKVDFDIKGMNGIFYIRAYIKDVVHKNIRAYNSDKLSIDSWEI
ncbi:hypothetical protein [Psychrobacter sp. 1044]|uniref:hypothetical protein n=1 Tax=Psychrobacter sp. 1044 TaxID=2772562 RepID=UPI0019191788|nr:hypothetical protein [Psychrobacter sp. 1044]